MLSCHLGVAAQNSFLFLVAKKLFPRNLAHVLFLESSEAICAEKGMRERHKHTIDTQVDRNGSDGQTAKSHKTWLLTFFHGFTHMSAQTYMCAQKRKTKHKHKRKEYTH